MVKKIIETLLKKTCKILFLERKTFFVKNLKIEVFIPTIKEHGDYSTNIAFILAKETKENPVKIADLLIEKLKKAKDSNKIFENIENAGGFINFFIKKEFLQNKLKEILRSDNDFGKVNIGKGKKLQVEFISANPTGPLTVGNARGGPFGDCLANVLEFAGYKVEKAYYVNDYGKQIIELGKSVLGKGGKYQGDYIKELQKRIKEKDPYLAGRKAAKIVINEMIKPTTKELGIKYDEWFYESKLYTSKRVDKVIDLLRRKGLTYEKDGALWFKSKKFGDVRDRVLIKKDGWKTYLAGDIAYHQYKFEDKKFDKVINIWGADHYGDIPGLQAGVAAIGHKGKLEIILLQFVTVLKNGKPIKMSKRKGTYVTMDELLDEVGKDVVRFFFLEKSADTHLNFDLDLAKEQSEKNPVYYLQYAYARINSVIKNSTTAPPATLKGKNINPKFKNQNSKLQSKAQNLKLLDHPSEIELMKKLIHFPEVIEDTAKSYQVQKLPKYALELASAFHQFYQNCRVLTDDEKLTQARVALLLATKIVLENLFKLMGISAPKKM